MCLPQNSIAAWGFSFPFLYVDSPPFSVPDRSDLWVGSCNVCMGTHILRRSSHPCCSNAECPGAFSDTEVIPMLADQQDALLATYILGGEWAVKQILVGVCEVR